MESFKLLVNEAWDTSRLLVLDTDSSSLDNKRNVSEGIRGLTYEVSQSGTLAYVDTDAGLSADTLALLDCLTLSGEDINFVNYTSYSGSKSVIYDGTNFNPTFVGPNLSDFWYEFSSISGAEGFGLEITNAPVDVGKLFFGNRVQFNFLNRTLSVNPIDEFIRVNDQYHRVNRRYDMSLTAVDQDTVDRLNELNITNRFVLLYDSSEKHFKNYLIYGFIPKVDILVKFDDLYDVNFSLYEVSTN